MTITRATALAAIACCAILSIEQTVEAQPSSLTQLEQGLQGGATSPAAADPNAPGYVGFEPDEEIDDGKGVLVKGVKNGTPAAASGLKAGDRIIDIGGKPIRNLNDYDAIVKRPGAKLVYLVERAGRQQSLAVTVGVKPATVTDAEPTTPEPQPLAPTLSPPGPAPTLSPPASGSFAPGLSPPASGSFGPGLSQPAGSTPPSTLPAPSTLDPSPRSGGITAQPLDTRPSSPPSSAPSTLPSFGPAGGAATGTGGASLGITMMTPDQVRALGRTRRGAYIERVKPNSPAEMAGLPAGAVIVQMDTRSIGSDEDLKAAIQAARPGQDVELSYFDSNDRFGKKSVRLGEIPATGAPAPGTGGFAAPGGGFGGTQGTVPPAEASPRSGLSGRGRPLINMAENLGRNAGLIPTGPTGPSTVYDPLAMAALQQSVVELTASVKSLEERLRAMEGRMGGAGAPASSLPASTFGSPQTPGFGTGQPPLTPGFGPSPTPGGTTP